MAEKHDRPSTDTSPSGEISAKQNEDGTYEIVAGDSSATNMAPSSDTSETRKDTSADSSRQNDEGLSASPLTIGLVVLTLMVAAGTVVYFATGTSDSDAERATSEEDLSFQPYAADDEVTARPVASPKRQEQAIADEDANSFDQDVGPRERKTEIIVLEEDMEEDESANSDQQQARRPQGGPDALKSIKMGPGTAARIRDSARLNIDPAKLRDIEFTNGNVPKAEGEVGREDEPPAENGARTPEDQPPEDLQAPSEEGVDE